MKNLINFIISFVAYKTLRTKTLYGMSHSHVRNRAVTHVTGVSSSSIKLCVDSSLSRVVLV